MAAREKIEPIPSKLGRYIREKREEAGWGTRDLCRKIEQSKLCGGSVSPAYLSQVETGDASAERVGADFLWAVGCALRIDPQKLYVMSRSWIDDKYEDPVERDKLFFTR